MRSTLVLSDVGDETWGAVLEDDLVVELHVENAHRPGIAGNIYKGRVSRVLPGMQAAFVDIGTGRDTFLHVSDLPAAASGAVEFEADEDGDEPEAVPAPETPPPARASPVSFVPIQDLLREGQDIV